MTAPERIWMTSPDSEGEVEVWLDPDDGGIEYILHTPAALAASPLVQEIVAEAVQWQPITDETPTDTVLLLGWHGFGGAWETATDYWYNPRGKWYHGSATHWMPLPAQPAAIRARGE
jgi:hypothetical protein